MIIATIFRSDDEPRVRCLAEDVAMHCPGAEFVALHVALPGHRDGGHFGVGIRVITLSDLGIDDGLATQLWIALEPTYLCTLMAPTLLAHLLNASPGESVIFLSPDTHIVSPLEGVVGPGISLTARFLAPPTEDGLTPITEDLLQLGAYDDGFLGAVPEARADLARIGADAAGPSTFSARGRGPRWDLFPARASHTIVADPGVGVAYWNLHERPVHRIGGVLSVHGSALKTMRLPGFDPERPYLLSIDQGSSPRVLLSESPDLQALCSRYAERLLAHGGRAPSGNERVGTLLVDAGVRTAVRNALRDHLDGCGEAPPDPRGDGADHALREWLQAPASGARDPRISRYLMGVWDSQQYTRTMFPHPLDEQAEHFLTWVWVTGPTGGVALDMMPPSRRDIPEPTATMASTEALPGINLVGFLRAGFGIGEATRLLARALDDGDVPHATLSISHTDLQDQVAGGDRGGDLVYDTNLICVNIDWLDTLSRRLGPGFLDGRYSIGTWWWESNVLPDRLVAKLPLLDEIWAGSNYIADALRAYTDMPIRVFPLPIPVPDIEDPPNRVALGLPDGFLFMFSFDFNSTVERKNPEGVIEAFTRAFAPGEGPSLVLKTINGDRHLADLERLRHLIADRPDISLVDRFLPPDERDAWARACDCYVSLHRCEGFGLTMAEAMALGKPVIATGYSANLDFMDEQTAYLVGYSDWVLEKPAGPYPAGTQWADPDVDDAARLMRAVFDDPAAAGQRGAAARAHIAATRTSDRLAHFIEERLKEIRMTPYAEIQHPFPTPLREALAYNEQRKATRTGALSRFIHRAIRPYTANADELDRRILGAEADAAERVRRIELRTDELESEARRLTARAETMQDSLMSWTRQAILAIQAVQRESQTLHDRLYPDIYLADPNALLVRGEDGVVRLGFDSAANSVAVEQEYVAFEDVFRGPRQRVLDGLAPYVPLLRGHSPIVDVGCGRGEMLELLAQAGLDATGIDIDAAMIARCTDAGVRASQADAVEYLEALPPKSLGAIFSAQVIEHLPWAQLSAFLRAAHNALRPDGLFIAETVNPHCLQALKAFWLDPTHQHPIFPESCLAHCQQAGFTSAYVRFTATTGTLDIDRRESDSYAVIATT